MTERRMTFRKLRADARDSTIMKVVSLDWVMLIDAPAGIGQFLAGVEHLLGQGQELVELLGHQEQVGQLCRLRGYAELKGSGQRTIDGSWT